MSIPYKHSLFHEFADLATGLGCRKHHLCTRKMVPEGIFKRRVGNGAFRYPLGPFVFREEIITNPGTFFSKRHLSITKLNKIPTRLKLVYNEWNALDSLEESLKWDKSPKSKK